MLAERLRGAEVGLLAVVRGEERLVDAYRFSFGNGGTAVLANSGVSISNAVVGNSGSGFAPNVIPAALWLGAGVAAFLIHVRAQPKHALHFSSPAKLAGKIAIPIASTKPIFSFFIW